MADDTAAAPAPTPSPDVLSQLAPYLALLQQGQAQPQRDMTPVEQDWRSKIGEALGGPVMMPNMTPAERQASGLMALRHFGLGMLGAVGHMQGGTIGSLLGAGFEGAERGALGAQQMDASTLAAQQEYQQKQQEMRIAALKEALPLLTLQQSQQRLGALGNLPSSLGGATPPTGTNIATGGSIAAPLLARDTSMTAGQQANNSGNLMMAPGAPAPAGAIGAVPVSGGRYVAAFPDAATGIAAQSDNLTAYQTQHGINTIRGAVTRWVGDPKADLGSYAADIAKLAGVDPDAKVDLSDPKIQRAFFIAQQPHESGKAWLKPEDVDKGIAIAAARRGGGTQAATPPAAPTAQTPPAPAPRAPIGTPADALPAGGATVAGPAGAATVGAPRPAGPGVPGDVNAIIAGMTGAGANAATLAAGGAQSAPQAPAQVATTAPVVPQTPPTDQTQPAPGGPPAFNYAPRQPPPGLIQGGALTPDEQRVVQDARNSYSVAIRAASLIPDAAKAAEARAQAEATLQGTLDKELSTRAGRTDAGAKQLTDWYAEDYKQQEAVHKALLDNYYQNQNEQTKQANAIALERTKGDEARRTGAAASENTYVLDQRKDFAAQHDNIRNALDDYQMLRQFSDAAGTSSPIDNIQIGDKTGRDLLVQYGLGTQAQQQKWGAQQAFNAVINKSILAARQGVSMGQLSDRDMNFLQHMTVSQLQNPQTRSDIISYLEQTAFRKKQYMDRVEQLWDGGQGTTWGKARTQAESEMQKTDILPNVPQNWGQLPAADQKAFVTKNNLKNGSLVRGPDGKLTRYEVGQ